MPLFAVSVKNCLFFASGNAMQAGSKETGLRHKRAKMQHQHNNLIPRVSQSASSRNSRSSTKKQEQSMKRCLVVTASTKKERYA